MARAKSPSYPSYSLVKAIKHAGVIFAADRRNPIDRSVAATHMNYSSLSGAADMAISTMMQYGLLEKSGKGEVRISQTAVDILHPNQPSDRKAALIRAAFSPSLFNTLKSRFPDDRFSNEALRSFLMREGFLERAISPVLSAYSETTAFLEQEKAYESGGASGRHDEESDQPDDDEKKFGGADVGDLIRWESEGVLKPPEPRRVRAISEDGQWVFVEQSGTGIPMDQVIVEQGTTPGSKGDIKPPTLAIPNSSPLKGVRKEVFALDEGDVTLIFPDSLSATSFEDLEAYLKVFLRKAKRRAGADKTGDENNEAD